MMVCERCQSCPSCESHRVSGIRSGLMDLDTSSTRCQYAARGSVKEWGGVQGSLKIKRLISWSGLAVFGRHKTEGASSCVW